MPATQFLADFARRAARRIYNPGVVVLLLRHPMVPSSAAFVNSAVSNGRLYLEIIRVDLDFASLWRTVSSVPYLL